MKNYQLIFILMILSACEKQKNNGFIASKNEQGVKIVPKQEKIYSFDSTSMVKGCADILLQKISKDLQYELIIDIEFDSITNKKKIDIAKYAKFVKVYLNKYPNENKYIKGVCDDKIYSVSKTPNKYVALTGNLNITYYDERYISILVKNLVLQDSTKKTIFLPIEIFEKIAVHWKGG